MKEFKKKFWRSPRLKDRQLQAIFQQNLQIVDSVADFTRSLDRPHYVDGDPISFFFEVYTQIHHILNYQFLSFHEFFFRNFPSDKEC